MKSKWRAASRLAEKLIAKYNEHLFMNAATSSRNPNKFWNYVKKSLDKRSTPPLRDDANSPLIFDDSLKAEALNKFLPIIRLTVKTTAKNVAEKWYATLPCQKMKSQLL